MAIDDFKAAEDVPTNLNNLICKSAAVTRPWNVTGGSERGSFSNSLTPMLRVTWWFRRQWLLHIRAFGAFLAVSGSLTRQLVMQLERCNFVSEEMKRWVFRSRKGITNPPAHNKEWLILRFQTSGGEPADLTAADEDSPTSPIIAPPLLWGLRRVRGLKPPHPHPPPQTPELMDRIWAPITKLRLLADIIGCQWELREAGAWLIGWMKNLIICTAAFFCYLVTIEAMMKMTKIKRV